MIFVFAAAGAMERSSSISNGGFLSTCFPIEKPRRSKSGGFPIPVWRSSAGIAEARLRDLGKAGSAQSEAGRRSLALTQKSLGDDAELLSRAAQSLLKSLIQNSAAEVPPEAKPPELAPWHSGMTKRKARKESASSSAASRIVPPDPGSGSKKDRCGHQCPKAWGKPTNGVYLSPNEAATSAHADSSRRQTAH